MFCLNRMTRTNGRNKTYKNWHKQIRSILDKQKRTGDILDLFGRAGEAMSGHRSSTLSPASHTERRNATYRRLKREMNTIRGKSFRTLNNNKRLGNIEFAMKEYAPPRPKIDLTFQEFTRVIRKYFPEISEKEIDEVYLPKTVAVGNITDKSEELRSLVRKAMAAIEKQPESTETEKDKKAMQQAMRWLDPTGRLPAGYRGGGGILRFTGKAYPKKGSIRWESNGPRMSDLMPVLERYSGLSRKRLRKILTPVANPAFSKKNAMRRIIFRALQNIAKEPESAEKRRNMAILRSAAKYAIPTGVIGYANLPSASSNTNSGDGSGSGSRSRSPSRSRSNNRNGNGRNLYNRFLVSKGGTRRAQRGGACPCSAGLPPNPLGL